jgi:hypothetical protein
MRPSMCQKKPTQETWYLKDTSRLLSMMHVKQIVLLKLVFHWASLAQLNGFAGQISHLEKLDVREMGERPIEIVVHVFQPHFALCTCRMFLLFLLYVYVYIHVYIYMYIYIYIYCNLYVMCMHIHRPITYSRARACTYIHMPCQL